MSCSQAFDEMVKCYGVGGQVRNVYRYGAMRDCKDKWKMFKFCVLVKMESTDVQKRRTQRFYKERLAEKLIGGSSEDIWKMREKPIHEPFLTEWTNDDEFEAN